MLQHLVVELGRLQLAAHLVRHGVDHRLEPLGQPLVGDDRLVGVLLVGAGPVVVQVVEQPAGLVLLGVQTGQPEQPPGVVARVDDLRLDPDGRAGEVGGDVELGHVEAEGVQPTDPRLDPVHLAAVELLHPGELAPQLAIAVLDGLHQLQRIERRRRAAHRPRGRRTRRTGWCGRWSGRARAGRWSARRAAHRSRRRPGRRRRSRRRVGRGCWTATRRPTGSRSGAAGPAARPWRPAAG